MAVSTFLELLAGGVCAAAGMCAWAWLTNRVEQRRHDQGRCRNPYSGRC